MIRLPDQIVRKGRIMQDDSDDFEDTGDVSPYLTTREAADYLRLKPNTLEQKRMTGDGPPYRDHGVIVYHIDDLRRWSEEQSRIKTDGKRKKLSLFTNSGEDQ